MCPNKQTINNITNNQKFTIMKNSEKNSSKVNNNNTNNNEVLSPESIKAQLKAACQDMNAKETKEYIKGLAGYELRLTGQKPTQHYTVFCGEVRVCNVEQVQGIKADGTARGCTSTVKVNFLDAAIKLFENKTDKLKQDLMDSEVESLNIFFDEYNKACEKIQNILDNVNDRIAEKAKEAAKLKRDTEKGKKAAEKLDNSTLLQVLIAKGIDEVEAKKLLNIA